MEEKCRVVVCTGTACYVMGGAEILTLEDRLPPELAAKVSLEGATCLGRCKDKTQGKPPFVSIDGEVLADADLEKVSEAVKRHLAEK